MRDPAEGLAKDGFITTGVSPANIPSAFAPIIDDLLGRVDPDVSVFLYGSVATGQARRGRSDVDVVALGMPSQWAQHLGDELSARHAGLTRGVAIGAWTPDDLGEGDAGYGNRIFLKHYCAHLAGPNPAAALPAFRGDARAARGFNGDLPAVVKRWNRAFAVLDPSMPEVVDDLARRVGRKTLFAVAGLVSVHDGTWTTDRATAAHRWSAAHPDLRDDLELLLAWGDQTTPVTADEVRRVLEGTVPLLAEQFIAQIGQWR